MNKTEYEMLDILISTNQRLTDNIERMSHTINAAVHSIDHHLEEKQQLHTLCGQLYRWLKKKKHPTAKEQHWKGALKTILKEKGH